ncbi:MAG TPA: pyridoxamine 5'-phosphate oxidase family protein [Acidimicrobiales bacterium]|nr:pyridoxamine 5'-phosphate oxidase family protein [Acidimicrobiales bacterium]HWI03355.1 pyridoxamine 5'-phosphate oxidase family protein [Acidimicrobiales bacterium]
MGPGSNALEVLDEGECLALLGAAEVGRVGVVVDGQPLIFPVNHVLEGRSILVRTDSSRMLGGASLSKVAFEADGFDAGARSGWTVLAEGIGNDVTEALDATSERLQAVPVAPWAPGPKPRLLRIDVRTITGRRFAGERSDT